MRVRLLPFTSCASFSAVGAAAGWLSYDLLSNPLVDLAPIGQRGLAAGCGAALGGAVGLLLAPSASELEWLPPRPSMPRIAAVVLAAGAAGGVLFTSFLPSPKLAFGALGGIVSAVPLLLAAPLLVAALRRTERARAGSIVAWSDLRAVFGLLAATAGATSALALLDWPASGGGLAAPPREAFGLVFGAFALLVTLLLADLVALWRVGRLAAQSSDLEDGWPHGEAPAAPRVDLGLGDRVAARLRLGTAYRGGARPISLVVGDPEEARAALRRSLGAVALGVALIELVALGHGLARDPELAAAYSARLCDEGTPSSCRAAALLAERAGMPDEEASRLHAEACARGDSGSCLAIDLLGRRNAPPW